MKKKWIIRRLFGFLLILMLVTACGKQQENVVQDSLQEGTAETESEQSQKDYLEVSQAVGETENFEKYETAESDTDAKQGKTEKKADAESDQLSEQAEENEAVSPQMSKETIADLPEESSDVSTGDTQKKDEKENGEDTGEDPGDPTCSLVVECTTVLNHMDNLTEGKEAVIPENGIIYSADNLTFSEGETAFDLLLREMQNHRIPMEYTFTQVYNSNYIEGINNLYEFDCGELSGWMYCVNNVYPNYGCSQYQLAEGDVVEFHYTCDLGRDLGQ